VVIEEASVHPTDWPYERCPLASESVEGWAAVARACSDEGALVFAALGHSGGQGSSAYSQLPLWAPSRVPEVATREVPKSMEPEDIEELVDGFAVSAVLAAEAGLHGVEINAGQFSILRQFLSGLTNLRDDEWGEDHALLVHTVLERVRSAAPQLAVGLRLSCDELAPWAGIVPEEGARLAARLAPFVDYITVVRGSIFTASATRPDSHTDPGFNRELVSLVRNTVRGESSDNPEIAPVVVAQGSIVDVSMAEDFVSQGCADAVEMTRAQIADAYLASKISNGLPARVRPCILCNQWCQVRDVRNPIVGCVCDPASGHEWEAEWNDFLTATPATPATSETSETSETSVTHSSSSEKCDVLVVGAGPAGLECARTAAELGHRVTVVERASEVGGSLRVAAKGLGRARFGDLIAWLDSECRFLAVEVRTGEEVTHSDLESHLIAGGDVVLCTGSVPGLADYSVAHGKRVRTALEALDDTLEALDDTSEETAAPEPVGAVLVWDPIGGPIGVSVAETLRSMGRDVILATSDVVVGQELARTGDLAPSNVRLQSAGVRLQRHSILRLFEADGAILEDRFSGEKRLAEASELIDAGHRLPDDSLWRETGERLTRAGDALAPRGIGEAVLEGRRAAISLSANGPPTKTRGKR